MKLASLCYAALPLGLLFVVSSPAVAADPPPGRLLAAQCAQCHGTNGNSTAGMDSLAGKGGQSLYEALLEMKRAGKLEMMHLQARGYTDNELWLIAQYFATLPH